MRSTAGSVPARPAQPDQRSFEMQVIIVDSTRDIGRTAAARIARIVQGRRDAVIGLATGSSPLAIYAELARRVDEGGLDCSAVRAFALDEYVGLPPGHPQSYRAVIDKEVVQPLGLTPSLVYVPDGAADDVRGPAMRTTVSWPGSVRSTSRSSGSDRTVTSVSTNPPPRSPPAPGSRRWLRPPEPPTRVSSVPSTRYHGTASPRAWHPFSTRANSSWWLRASARRKPWPTWSKDP